MLQCKVKFLTYVGLRSKFRAITFLDTLSCSSIRKSFKGHDPNDIIQIIDLIFIKENRHLIK